MFGVSPPGRVDADEEQPYHVADGSKLLIGQATFTLSITWER